MSSTNLTIGSSTCRTDSISFDNFKSLLCIGGFFNCNNGEVAVVPVVVVVVVAVAVAFKSTSPTLP